MNRNFQFINRIFVKSKSGCAHMWIEASFKPALSSTLMDLADGIDFSYHMTAFDNDYTVHKYSSCSAMIFNCFPHMKYPSS